MEIDIVNLSLNLVIAILVAIITTQLTLKHFYKQEIWLRKDKKYSEIIEKLSILLHYYEKEYNLSFGVETNIDIDESEFQSALKDMEKIRYSTGYLIDPKVNVIIDTMIKDFAPKGLDEHLGNYFSQIDRINAELKTTINKVIDIAKKDLKIK